MKIISDKITGTILAMAGGRSPWGGSKGGGDDKGQEGAEEATGDKPAPEGDAPAEAPKGPRNPWGSAGETPPRRSANIEDIFRARNAKSGGGGSGGGGGAGGNFPRMPERGDGKSWLPVMLGGAALVWLFFGTTHMIGPKEEGIVSTFGKYSRTITPGVSLTLPWPIQQVDVEEVTKTQRETIPDGDSEKLMLTSDQNLIDLSYQVRWNIKNLKLYKYQLDDPRGTIREVAEAAMRASVAEIPLNGVMGGTGRARIEDAVSRRMQSILDAYRSGVLVQGVEIKKADPPEKVKPAFQQVTAAQQDAQRDLSNAQAWAQQLTARAQGDAAAFDKVYEQYKLAPAVTRRRMYYETMERVLSANDKVIVESGGVTSYLPLPEVRRKQAQTPPTSSTQGAQ